MIERLSVLASLALLGCATTYESQAQADFDESERTLTEQRDDESPRPAHFDGTLDEYVKYALENSPELRATFEEWRAATHRIARTRRLPDPVFTYAYFVRNVETRVGPQRHKFGIQQAFPWPTRLSAGADAASLASQSAQRRYEAAALELTRRVADAYYDLWLIRRTREVQRDQKAILESFSGTVRGQVEVGNAGLADLGQVDLNVSRITDTLQGLDEAERTAKARLLAAVGAPSGTATPTRGAPPPSSVPAESEQQLLQAALDHPRIRAMALMAQSRLELADSADAQRYPDFVLGAEYIETGPADNPNVPESGKDPIIVSLSVKLPLWGGSYSEDEAEARAESAAFRARENAARDQARAELEKALGRVRDSARRVRLYQKTLVPQADAVYGSVVGAYQSGRSSVAAVLIAQRDLLELQLGLYRAQAEHAKAWAELEAVVGHAVSPKGAS